MKLYESELRFTTDSAGLSLARGSKLLEAARPDTRRRTLTCAYFETPAFDLKKQRISLHVRRAGRSAPVMILNWPTAEANGHICAGEIGVRTPSPEPDIDLFDETVAARLKQVIDDRPLQRQFETQVRRSVRLLKLGGSQIEVAFDSGVIAAGNRRWPISEIELELKSGEASDLYDLGAQLAEALPVRLEVTSKAERAFLLAANEAPAPVKASAQAFPPNASLDDAITAVMASTLGHFVSNWAALRNGDDPESIHQMRVALRRLRVALAIFNRALPCTEFESFRAAAKRIAAALGTARECDVVQDLVESLPHSHFDAESSFASLLATIKEQRVATYAHARTVIDSPETSAFAVRLQGFLARRGWRNALSGSDLARLTEPAEIFAAETLTRLHKRATKRGRKLLALADAERHKVRIALKNIRYAAEYFGCLFGEGPAVRPYVQAVAQMQDLLGAHNDAVSVKKFLNAAVLAEHAKAERAAGIVLGWYARGASVADGELKKTWKAFKQIAPFWR